MSSFVRLTVSDTLDYTLQHCSEHRSLDAVWLVLRALMLTTLSKRLSVSVTLIPHVDEETGWILKISRESNDPAVGISQDWVWLDRFGKPA